MINLDWLEAFSRPDVEGCWATMVMDLTFTLAGYWPLTMAVNDLSLGQLPFNDLRLGIRRVLGRAA